MSARVGHDSIAAQEPTHAWILIELAPDGSDARRVALGDAAVEIGRSATGLACPDDAQMADRHARLALSEAGPVLEDLDGVSGVWLRVADPDGRPLEDQDQVWMGAQVLVFRRGANGWQIRHHGPDGRLRETHDVPEQGCLIGRASALVLDAADGQLSRRHAQVAFRDGQLCLFDRGAQNGSFLRLRAPEPLGDGAEFRIASARFRLEQQPIETPASHDDPGAAEELFEEPTRPLADSDAPLAEVQRADPSDAATVLNLALEPVADPPTRDSKADAADAPSPLSTADSAEPLARPAGRGQSLGARLRRLGRSAPAAAAPPPESSNASAQASTPRPDPRSQSHSGSDSEAVPESGRTPPGEAGSEPAPVAAALQVDRVSIVIDSQAGSVALEGEPGGTVLEAVQAAGLERGRPVDWECGDGRCGVCIVGVVEGADQLDPPIPATGEMKTIQITEQVAPDPKQYRLACLARVRGPVRLRKLT